jgi:antitoxin VapB
MVDVLGKRGRHGRQPKGDGNPQSLPDLVEKWWNGVSSVAVALNIKNAEVERLAEEVARLTGESKTEAVRRALSERKQRLAHRVDPGDREGRARQFLEREVWPLVPADELGRRLTTGEEDAILGFGSEGS